VLALALARADAHVLVLARAAAHALALALALALADAHALAFALVLVLALVGSNEAATRIAWLVGGLPPNETACVFVSLSPPWWPCCPCWSACR